MQPDTEVIKVGWIKTELCADGDSIVTSIRSGRPFEPETLECWAGLCARGGFVLDIGAYSALFAIIAAKQGCRVMAFEPLWAERCEENAALNGVHGRVVVKKALVSDVVGEATLKLNAAVRGMTSGASLVHPSGRGAHAQIEERQVPSVTVDSLKLAQCTAIKIDVERAEPLVLAGAQETLRRCRPVLLVEVLGNAEKRAVRAAVPDYRVERELDGRNWLMVAK